MNVRAIQAALALASALCMSLFSACPVDTTPAPEEGDGDDAPDVALELVADGLVSPVAVAFPDDGSGRALIADRVGTIRVLTREGELLEEPFLDLRDAVVELMDDFDERGLLGLALHPGFADNGRFFVYYSAPLRESAPDDFDHTSRVSELTVSESDDDRADRASERVLLEVDEPQFNHNAGALAFGPDGLLYISLGDGGGANDTGVGHPPLGNGQDVTTLLGSILRIDVDVDAGGAEPYGIPADNPFADGGEGRPEIFAWGFRNPYRISFDMAGERALYVGDAGQEQWEEVSVVERGNNYGWNIKEGTHCFDPDEPTVSPAACPDEGARGEPLIDPIIEYSNAKDGEGIGLVVVGGYVYRGDDVPALAGEYVFGDWSASFEEPQGTLLVASEPDDEGLWNVRELRLDDAFEAFILGFAQDLDGEVYVLTSSTPGPVGTTGRVWRLTSPGS